MAEETKVAEVKVENALSSSAALPDGSIATPQQKAEDVAFLFADEAMPTKDELMGAPPEEKGEEVIVEKPAEEKKAEETKVEEKKEEQEKKPETVPLAEHLKERRLRQQLQNDLLEVKRQVKELQTKGPSKDKESPSEAEGTKTSVSEFTKKAKALKEKMLDDPTAAMEKMIDLMEELPTILASTKKEEGGKEKKEEPKEDDEQVSRIIDDGMELMEQLVPGITDRENKEGPNVRLTTFAHENSFPKGLLPIITNPGTIVHFPGKSPRYLGDDAAHFVSFLNRVAVLKSAPSTKEVEAKLREDITKELTEKITKDLTEKFKTGKQPRTITELPGESDRVTDTIFAGKKLSEAEYYKLNDEDKQKYLMSD